MNERRHPHDCRNCYKLITDMEYIASGLYLGLCPACLVMAEKVVAALAQEGS